MRSVLAVVVVGVIGSVIGSVRPVEAKGPPETAEISAVIGAQFAGFRDPKSGTAIYAKNAMVAMTGGPSTPQVNKLTHADGKWSIFGPATVGKHKVRDLRVVVARDGKSAWASFVATVTVDGLSKTGAVDYRVTELFVSTSSGWQVASAAWSIGVSSAALAKAAKAGSIREPEAVFDQNLGDKPVIAALEAIGSSPIDVKTARAELTAIGPVTGEVAVGAKTAVAKLEKDWRGKIAVKGAVWAVTAGTTACATANVELTRAGARIPARLFAVFEQVDGAWAPVLLHLAVAP